MEIGFLFDNDGVLIDSKELHWQAWNELMKEENNFFMDEETFVSGFGKRNDLIIREIFPDISDRDLQKLASRKEECFRKVARGNITLLEGMEDFLKSLKKENIPRIIASSTPIENLKMFLSSTVLGNYFDAFVSSEEVAHGKPAPDVFLEAASRIKMPPSKCIVVEDAPVGIKAGKSAGCFVIGLETTYPKEKLQQADVIYPSPKELNLREIEKKL